MNAKTEEITSVADIVKWIVIPLMVVSGIVAFYYFAEVVLLYRVIALVAVIGISVAIALTTNKGRSVWAFVLESKQELKRVVWPTRDEAVRTTLLVFLMVFIVGLLLWLLDMVLFWGVQQLMTQGVK
jgi:preprotein translocase subunit SecE